MTRTKISRTKFTGKKPKSKYWNFPEGKPAPGNYVWDGEGWTKNPTIDKDYERNLYGFSKDEWNALNNMNLEYFKDQDFFAIQDGKSPDTGMTELQFVENQTGLSRGKTQRLVMRYLGLLDANKLKRARDIRGNSK